eukprot:663036-Pelagomonas_calceolata.AAC.2
MGVKMLPPQCVSFQLKLACAQALSTSAPENDVAPDLAIVFISSAYAEQYEQVCVEGWVAGQAACNCLVVVTITDCMPLGLLCHEKKEKKKTVFTRKLHAVCLAVQQRWWRGFKALLS